MSEEITNKWENLSKEDPFEEEIELDEALKDAEQPEESSPGADALDHPDYHALQEKLTETEGKVHENWEAAVRAKAELENVRKRAERDVENAHKFSHEKIIKDLLPVIDSLEQALGIESEESGVSHESMKQGIELTLQLLMNTLEKSKVMQINPEGENFDPQQHEAMSMVEQEGMPSGTIIQVFQKGYLLNDRIIRPARVIVAK